MSCGASGNTDLSGPPPVATVSISAPSTTLEIGATMQLVATAKDAAGNALPGRTVTWSSSNTSIALVSTSGLVSGVSLGTATVTATSEGRNAGVAITITPAAVAVVAVAPPPAIIAGNSLVLTATLRDARGNVLTGRMVNWSSSNTAVATVTSAGVLSALAAGTTTISAMSEGKTGTTVATVVGPSIVTAIKDPVTFLSHCPTSDPAYATLRQDFELRSDGQLSTVIPTCTEPYTTTPVAQLTDELLAMQTLRLAYYMSQGTAGKLPWTSLAFYEWMKSEIGGINFVSSQGLSACCQIINGKKFIITSKKDTANRNFYRDWQGVSGWLALFAHEARHADGPGHVNGCPAFPLSTDPAGCDVKYDPAQISSYGIQYWLFAGWGTGALNVGIACLPETTARSLAQSAVSNANGYLTRFVQSPPPAVTATAPWGGVCVP